MGKHDNSLQKKFIETSSQDDGKGRQGLPLRTTTTKSQTKYLTTMTQEPSETELHGSLTTTELKKPHLSRQVGEAHTRKGLVPHPYMVHKNLGTTYWEQRVPAPHQAPQPRVPV